MEHKYKAVDELKHELLIDASSATAKLHTVLLKVSDPFLIINIFVALSVGYQCCLAARGIVKARSLACMRLSGCPGFLQCGCVSIVSCDKLATW